MKENKQRQLIIAGGGGGGSYNTGSGDSGSPGTSGTVNYQTRAYGYRISAGTDGNGANMHSYTSSGNGWSGAGWLTPGVSQNYQNCNGKSFANRFKGGDSTNSGYYSKGGFGGGAGVQHEGGGGGGYSGGTGANHGHGGGGGGGSWTGENAVLINEDSQWKPKYDMAAIENGAYLCSPALALVSPSFPLSSAPSS